MALHMAPLIKSQTAYNPRAAVGTPTSRFGRRTRTNNHGRRLSVNRKRSLLLLPRFLKLCACVVHLRLTCPPRLSTGRTFTMRSLPLVWGLLLGRASAGSHHRQMPLVHAQWNSTTCKCFPGDACYPTAAEWSSLNNTVQGRLIATVPLGSPCHDPYYDETECAYLQDEWLSSGIQ